MGRQVCSRLHRSHHIEMCLFLANAIEAHKSCISCGNISQSFGPLWFKRVKHLFRRLTLSPVFVPLPGSGVPTLNTPFAHLALSPVFVPLPGSGVPTLNTPFAHLALSPVFVPLPGSGVPTLNTPFAHLTLSPVFVPLPGSGVPTLDTPCSYRVLHGEFGDLYHVKGNTLQLYVYVCLFVEPVSRSKDDVRS